MKVRKKPLVVEARQLTLDNAEELAAWSGGSVERYAGSGHVLIPTMEGDMVAAPGWWIIQGVAGEFYACCRDIFVATYDPVYGETIG